MFFDRIVLTAWQLVPTISTETFWMPIVFGISTFW